jgi:hypothetical protein
MSESPSEHQIRQMKSYNERVADVRESVAHALAYSQAGYSAAGAAKYLDTSASTVRSWWDIILVRYGPDPLLQHGFDRYEEFEELGDGDLMEMSEYWRQEWHDAAESHPDAVPDELVERVDAARTNDHDYVPKE